MVHLSCVLYAAIHNGATGSHKSATYLPAHYSEDVKDCYRCSSQYSSSKHGACITCYPRDECSNPKCAELAYYDKDLGSFNYCSRKCRDECELNRANEELKRGLKEFEDVPSKDTSNRAPGRRNSDKRVSSMGVTSSATQVTTTITATHQFTPHTTSRTWSNSSTHCSTSSAWSNKTSTHTTSNMSVGSASQPTTSTGTITSQSDTSSTISANPPVVTSHQQSTQTVISQPQSLSQSKIGNFCTVFLSAYVLTIHQVEKYS